VRLALARIYVSLAQRMHNFIHWIHERKHKNLSSHILRVRGFEIDYLVSTDIRYSHAKHLCIVAFFFLAAAVTITAFSNTLDVCYHIHGVVLLVY
jgi:hypothetical protein